MKEFDRKEHEVEDIAQASYAYWYVVTQYNSNDRKAKTIIEPEQARTFSALKEIQRHWIGEGRKRDETIQALRQALEFRKSYGVLALRLLFSQTSNESMTEQEQLHKQWIEEDLQRQPMVVRGCTNTSDDPDSPSRSAMVYKPPRRSPTDARENEAYVMTQIYTAERAMACTQYLQGLMYEKRNHPDDDDTTEEEEEEEEQQQQQRHHFDPHHAESGKLLVLFSFDGYQSNQSVTTTAMKTTSTVLQRLYPERLYRLIMLEPAFWMRALMTLMYPLLSTDTTNKLRLVTGKVRYWHGPGWYLQCNTNNSNTFPFSLKGHYGGTIGRGCGPIRSQVHGTHPCRKL